MRPTRKPSSLSLDRQEFLVCIAAGSAIGVGNFFLMPELVAFGGGLKVALLHVFATLLLGGTLVLAELLWGRWLQRPFPRAFEVVHPRLYLLSLVSYLALVAIGPGYFLALGDLLRQLVGVVARSGHADASWVELWASPKFSLYLYGVGAFTVIALPVLWGPRVVARACLALPILAFVGWGATALHLNRVFGQTGLRHLLSWDGLRIAPRTLLSTLDFSLFTLSAGFGILYHGVYYASQAPLRGGDHARPFWSRPGALVRVLAVVLIADLGASALALLVISPFGLSGLGPRSTVAAVSSRQILLDWLPQVLDTTFEGRVVLVGFLTALLAAGAAAGMTIIDHGVFSLQKEQHWTRRRAWVHVWIIGLLLLALPLAPAIGRAMERIGTVYILPTAALLIAWAVGWKMSFEAQRRLIGRGLVLDPFFRLWRFSVRYLTPGLLLYLLFARLF